MKQTKDLFDCESCHRVTHQTVERKRIDKKSIYHYTPPYPLTEPEMHGFLTTRTCKCGHSINVRFESDCKLGSCGTKKVLYSGANIANMCSVCNNNYSYGEDVETINGCEQQ